VPVAPALAKGTHVGRENGSDLHLSVRKVSFQGRWTAPGAIRVPLHDLPIRLQSAVCRCDDVPVWFHHAGSEAARRVPEVPPTTRTYARHLPALLRASCRFSRARAVPDASVCSVAELRQLRSPSAAAGAYLLRTPNGRCARHSTQVQRLLGQRAQSHSVGPGRPFRQPLNELPLCANSRHRCGTAHGRARNHGTQSERNAAADRFQAPASAISQRIGIWPTFKLSRWQSRGKQSNATCRKWPTASKRLHADSLRNLDRER
jgi:hypothetical protein